MRYLKNSWSESLMILYVGTYKMFLSQFNDFHKKIQFFQTLRTRDLKNR